MLWRFPHLPLIGLLTAIGPLPPSVQAEDAAMHAIDTVDFERHVAPLLLKHGCNAGSCHGAAEGQAGFRLSLFGHDPQFDYAAITAPGTGRVDLADPEQSLLLQKPSRLIDHEGGKRFAANSPDFELLSKWIAQRAVHSPGSGRLAALEITPNRCVLTEERPEVALQVIAAFADGDRLNVTALCDFRIDDDSVAAINEHQVVQRRRAGETVIVAVYAGRPASAQILAPRSGPNVVVGRSASENSIDQHVHSRLAILNIEPSPPSSDEKFLRRLMLTTAGQLPTPDQIRAFVEDESPDKRRRAIEAQLKDPLHAALWATRMAEITGSRDLAAGEFREEFRREEKWHAWFRARFEKNVPYDQLVHSILTATTCEQDSVGEFLEESIEAAQQGLLDDEAHYAQRTTLDLFWQRPAVNEEVAVESIAERIAAAFLGVRIECARCHKHPFDRWTQDEHRSFVNIFSQVRYGLSPDLRVSLADRLKQRRELARTGQSPPRIPAVREVFLTSNVHDLQSARTGEPLLPRPLGGEPLTTRGDRREAFADWLVAADNPFFTRNFVNRVWGFYFGRGLTEPIDAFSAANPPSHPELLDALAREFAVNGYDIRALEAAILSSDAWQRSSVGTESSRYDTRNYARFSLRVLPADVLVDAISTALGDRHTHAVEKARFTSQDKNVQAYFNVFSRPERNLTCDCERSSEPTLRQAMLLLSDAKLRERTVDATATLVTDTDASLEAAVEELFLRSLSRWPDQEEKEAACQYVREHSDRQEALADVLWSLLNTREFVTLH